MGYVAVRGGGKAIEESLKLLECERVSASASWGTDEIEGTFPELVDQVMGEASLYAPRLAALALKQAQGSPDEAVFLLRAFRSTLERPYVSRPVDTAQMRVARRVSAAFKDVPGGQVLGATRDYSHRLLAFDSGNRRRRGVGREARRADGAISTRLPRRPRPLGARAFPRSCRACWTTCARRGCLRRCKPTMPSPWTPPWCRCRSPRRARCVCKRSRAA